MTSNQGLHSWCAFEGNPTGSRTGGSIWKSLGRTVNRVTFPLFLVGVSVISSRQGWSQIASSMAGTPAATTVVTHAQVDLTYSRPTQRTMVNNYVFDAFGPYPITGAAMAAGINQFSNEPPEWNQGLEGYSRRFGSDVGIVAVGTTARYALAEAFKEDTLYYRCECTGMFPRVRHALVSTLIARRGDDGHHVFSFPLLVGPYAGTMTAVYGWYPNRFGPKDAFRMGNYNLLAYAGGNIALEFFYSGPHSLVARMHLNNLHGAPNPGPNHSGPNHSGPNQ
jgi:hypothetical protein